jgi:hypothetical protein
MSKLIDWVLGRRRIEVTCMLDMERSFDTLHAHAIPEGIDIRPGDSVVVHGAPTRLAFGERVVRECRATVTRAGWFDRHFTPIAAMFELGELYHVGFEPREALS